jgi:hypothetical protein
VSIIVVVVVVVVVQHIYYFLPTHTPLQPLTIITTIMPTVVIKSTPFLMASEKGNTMDILIEGHVYSYCEYLFMLYNCLVVNDALT